MAGVKMNRNIPLYQAILCIGLFVIFTGCFIAGNAFDIRHAVLLAGVSGIGGFILLFFLMIKYSSPPPKKVEEVIFPTNENRQIFLKGQHTFRSINTIKNILTGVLFALVFFSISIISHYTKVSGFFAETFLVHLPYCIGTVGFFLALLNIWAFIKGNIVPIDVSDAGIREGNVWLPWHEVRKMQTDRALPWGPLRLVVYPQKGAISFLIVDEHMSDKQIKQILVDIREYCRKNNHQIIFPKEIK
jgi:hypothetical protein